RLDLEDAAKDPSRKSPAIVPGDPSRSEILRRIVSTDPSERMPPPEAGDPLSPEAAAIIERWIAAGAPWSGHWAFEPVVRVEPPAFAECGPPDPHPEALHRSLGASSRARGRRRVRPR